MSGKRYGSGAKAAQKLDEPMPFELEVLRYDDEEVHQFTATNKVDTMLAARFMNTSDEQAGLLLRTIMKLISKTLDNKDGVAVQWVPEALPKPKNAGDKYEPKFRGPDGKLHPMDQAAKYLEFDQGSSRRRWEALLADEDVTAELESLAAITKDLIAASAGRPTDG